MEISDPRRILFVQPPNSDVLTLLKGILYSAATLIRRVRLTSLAQHLDLTGAVPPVPSDSASPAGLSHTWNISTQYYRAEVPIWVDEITNHEDWAREYLKPEAKVVLEVLGAFVLCFRWPVDDDELDNIRACLKAVAGVIDDGCGDDWDGARLAVAMPQSTTPRLTSFAAEQWDDLCLENGFEFVDLEARGMSQFGDKQGLDRLKEALEATDWAPVPDLDSYPGAAAHLALLDDDGDDLENPEAELGFNIEAAELEREMLGLSTAIHSQQNGVGLTESAGATQVRAPVGEPGGEAEAGEEEGQEEEQVERLDDLLRRVMAIRANKGL
ncbi:MAG: hypothetical protein M1819_005093 [Sarea resinae]|nr:MAG: hypothetical protein M1819_005093 [Sarea resinae]